MASSPRADGLWPKNPRKCDLLRVLGIIALCRGEVHTASLKCKANHKSCWGSSPLRNASHELPSGAGPCRKQGLLPVQNLNARPSASLARIRSTLEPTRCIRFPTTVLEVLLWDSILRNFPSTSRIETCRHWCFEQEWALSRKHTEHH